MQKSRKIHSYDNMFSPTRNLIEWIHTVFLAAAGFFLRKEEVSAEIKGQ